MENLPKSWDDIKISQYINLRPIQLSKLDSVERVIHTLAILLNKPTQEIEKLKTVDILGINNQLSFLNTEPLSKEVKDTFVLKGRKYKIILDASKLSGGQYMSVTTKLKQASDDPEYIYNNLHEVLASISIPLDEEITPSYFKDTSQLFYNELPMSIAYPICFFFFSLSQNLTIVMEDYSRKKLKKAESLIKEVQDSLSIGDG